MIYECLHCQEYFTSGISNCNVNYTPYADICEVAAVFHRARIPHMVSPHRQREVWSLLQNQ